VFFAVTTQSVILLPQLEQRNRSRISGTSPRPPTELHLVLRFAMPAH
jgi:hypothetical protein